MIRKFKTLQNKILFKNTTEQDMDTAFRLMSHVSKGDIESLEKEYQNGVNMNSFDYDLRTPFHIAASTGQYYVVKWFLDKKIPFIPDRFGAIPTTDAIRNKHYEIQELFQQYQEVYTEMIDQEQKQENKDIVFQLIIKENIFNYTLVAKTVDYYFNQLQLDDYYFKVFSPTQISKHISMLITAQNIAAINNEPDNLMINLSTGNQNFYICTQNNQKQTEIEIEKRLKQIPIDQSMSLIQIKSKNPQLQGGKQKLIISALQVEEYENPETINSDNLYLCTKTSFVQNRDRKVLQRYQKLLEQTYRQPNIQTQVYKDDQGDSIFMIGVNEGRSVDSQESHSSSQVELTKLFQDMNINVKKKFIETFSNGVVIYSIYVDKECNQNEINDILQIANGLFNIPDTIFRQKMLNKEIDGNQAIYLQTCAIFTFYFIHNKMEDYESLSQYLKNDPQSLNRLVNLKQSLVSETVNFDKLYQIISKYQDISLCFYQNFLDRLDEKKETYQDIVKLLKPVEDSFDKQIFNTIDNFNKSIVKTNFFNPKKSASSFRLDPQVFLKQQQLPEIPFGMYLTVGRYFTGMHIRFRDISRGGVRVIKSNNQNYEQNRKMQFNETFGLAYTQKKKNKDIPESGSKGTILLANGKNHMLKQSFMQYVDAMSDIMLNVPGVADLNKKPELIFLGPDENSADLMDPACLFMKKKNYKMWKSFTTGKSPSLGGIPHDVYGMTTNSVRQYVKGIQKKLGLKEEECTKFMTGGPDGDLGSNEILLGNEKIIGIVDGSGVLYDPEGLDREQIVQLAKQRKMVMNFNGKLSTNGYLVSINDVNRTLPTGQFVESGLVFRNNFHLNEDVQGDFFVPCGGRPESVNLQNVQKMFKKDGSPRFKYIVEGANLFFSEGARKKLESSGVILFKDSSTNKGGVTSSSFEVQAALSLKDQEFMQLMTIQNDEIPQFYQNYVKEIIKKVEDKAQQEFEYIWNEHQKTGLDNCVISDALSNNMNNLADIIMQTNLFDQPKIKKNVMMEVIPQTLQDLVGIDELLNRIPKNYQLSLFCKHIGAKYYYTYGSNSNIYQFYTFMKLYDR